MLFLIIAGLCMCLTPTLDYLNRYGWSVDDANFVDFQANMSLQQRMFYATSIRVGGFAMVFGLFLYTLP